MNQAEPLAYRMRPKTLEEYEGQEHVIGPGKILYRTIKADRLSSIILFGPPGCGKTSLAKVISETTKYKFYKINAVTAGVADIKKIVEETKNFMMNPTGKSILFIDEIHRFNKLQQDALLPLTLKLKLYLLQSMDFLLLLLLVLLFHFLHKEVKHLVVIY